MEVATLGGKWIRLGEWSKPWNGFRDWSRPVSRLKDWSGLVRRLRDWSRLVNRLRDHSGLHRLRRLCSRSCHLSGSYGSVCSPNA